MRKFKRLLATVSVMLCMSMLLGMGSVFASDLSKLSSYINSHDSWSPINNCSTFSAGIWNQIMTQTQLNNGTPDNPDILAESIMAVSEHFTISYSNLPSDYGVYYVENGALKAY